MPITYTSGEQVEVYRFSLPVTIGVPLAALILQAFLPRTWVFFNFLDLPLLVTIFFAMARRKPTAGLLTGAIIGLAQDALGPKPIGMFGIAKTLVGFVASSLGSRIDAENAGARFLLIIAFYLLQSAAYFAVARYLVNLSLHWTWRDGILSALANAVFGVGLYFLLDKLKQRT